MGIAEIVALLIGATKLAETLGPIIQRMLAENRTELTPAELARVKAQQVTAEEDWQTVLAQMLKETP